MALGKRRNELQAGTDTREVLKFYNQEFLDKNMYMFLTLMLVFYSMWCVDASNIAKFGNNLMLSVPILMLITMKYNINIEGKSEGDPIEVLFSDKILILLVLIFVSIVGVIVII